MAIASAKHPGNSVLAEMAVRPKMTFARMARELTVDRKTVVRWCRDVGIEKCGANGAKSDTGLPGGDAGIQVGETIIPKSVTGRPVTETPSGDDVLEVLQRNQAWLTEFVASLHDRIRFLEEGMSGASCQLPGAHVGQDDLHAEIIRIAGKITNKEVLSLDEQYLIDDLKIVLQEALGKDLARLETMINGHYHIGLSVSESLRYAGMRTMTEEEA